MIRLLLFFFLLGSQSSTTGCQKGAEQTAALFDSIPVVHPLKPLIREVSGIADSRKNKGFIWAHEDSGNPAHLYLINHNGTVAKTIMLEGITNRDWEELQLCGNQLYLAEIGDNQKQYEEYRVHIFEEPEATADKVVQIQTIKFKYADGSRDAEAFLVDPVTKDIYIITKSDNPARIYKLSFPYGATQTNTATQVGTIPYSGVVGAALSPDGKEIIVKTYIGLQHYTRTEGENLVQTLQKPFKNIPYQLEPQGEAVAFSVTGDGYFTLSEKGMLSAVNLYFYKRK